MRAFHSKLVAIAVLLGVGFWSCPANAVTYTLQFTASGFLPGGAPQDPVSGTLVFDKFATDFSIVSLTSIDLTIAGHTYGVGELGFINNAGPNVAVGGTINGVTGGSSGTDDFALLWNQTSGSYVLLVYTCLLQGCEHIANAGSTVFTEGLVSAAIPLPAALPLFATGLGALGLLGWRKKRKSAAA